METSSTTEGNATSISRPQNRRGVAIATAFMVGVGVGIAGTVGYSFWLVRNQLPEIIRSTIPQVSNVSEGFVKPSQLEIRVRDVDGEGYRETYLIYKGKRYFLKEKNGKPVIEDYYQ